MRLFVEFKTYDNKQISLLIHITMQFVKRISLAVTLIALNGYTNFQIKLFFITFFISSAMIVEFRPTKYQRSFQMELFNDLIIYVICLVQITFQLEDKNTELIT